MNYFSSNRSIKLITMSGWLETINYVNSLNGEGCDDSNAVLKGSRLLLKRVETIHELPKHESAWL